MNPTSTHPSPSARYRLDIFPQEKRMSHSVNSPYLFDNQTNTCILDLGGLWDASDIEWSGEGQRVSMKLWHYVDRSVTFRFEVDVEAGYATLSAADYGNLLRGSIEGVVEEMARTTELRTIFY